MFQLPETTFIGGTDKALPLREIVSRLETVYCGSIGAEYMHLQDLDQINWIREKLETPGALEHTKDQKRLLLARYGSGGIYCLKYSFPFNGVKCSIELKIRSKSNLIKPKLFRQKL